MLSLKDLKLIKYFLLAFIGLLIFNALYCFINRNFLRCALNVILVGVNHWNYWNLNNQIKNEENNQNKKNN